MYPWLNVKKLRTTEGVACVAAIYANKRKRSSLWKRDLELNGSFNPFGDVDTTRATTFFRRVSDFIRLVKTRQFVILQMQNTAYFYRDLDFYREHADESFRKVSLFFLSRCF